MLSGLAAGEVCGCLAVAFLAAGFFLAFFLAGTAFLAETFFLAEDALLAGAFFLAEDAFLAGAFFLAGAVFLEAAFLRIAGFIIAGCGADFFSNGETVAIVV
ncbi:MAG: hypothetical protein HOF95_01065 [Rhodospirillales bacterium]|nr:hypothetical protein [Rhodospirillales bacterium]MBT5077111.1 hypothetical protein [Rhodospirillales bacterium]MBT5112829.1 hypothetical protein [Rhodospirillales bacterium]MBT5673600.1 hypothetical protein [Rhodospirillales bacterium]MBT6186258.1 hypothetical protein [Rhodospirillales bacterium]